MLQGLTGKKLNSSATMWLQ